MGEDDRENERESEQAANPERRREEVDVVGHGGGQLNAGSGRAMAGRAEGRHGECRDQKGRYPEGGVAPLGRRPAESQQSPSRAERPDEKGSALEPTPAPFGLRDDEADRLSKCLDERHLVDGGRLDQQMSKRAKQGHDDTGNGDFVRPVTDPRHEVIGVAHRRQRRSKDNEPQHQHAEHRKSAEEDGPSHERLRGGQKNCLTGKVGRCYR